MNTQPSETSETVKVFGSTVKALAEASPNTWTAADSSTVAVKVIGTLRDKTGNLVTLSDDQRTAIGGVFDAKQLQKTMLERIVASANTELDEQVRELIERVLDPALFQQALISAKLKQPSRIKRTALAELIG